MTRSVGAALATAGVALPAEWQRAFSDSEACKKLSNP